MPVAFADAAGRMNEAILRNAGENVTFTHSGGSALVSAVVTTPDDVDEQEIGLYRECFVQLSGLPVTPVKGNTITVEGTAYRVETLEFDGAGGLNMSIRRVG